ncbi:M20/M25/M40 family metallo-hydrolase [Alicyclobacillus sp.]|uniref:M20/M25/M40 family metallo-hydrolase n=1 Tax=Alicyclobacillus sp. TaxID=61169 RepID=UPI0025C567B0|nr:M20/M25/M40 family metallo-hydrolase [Alicyclobacillus sp.]MCL6515782.1 M20/M25/M40 family metallo-hydrolase [Alicyclobacillus sp.]
MKEPLPIRETELAAWLLEALRIDSPSRGEAALWRRCAQFLEQLGFVVRDDGTGRRIGGSCGNLIGFLRGDPRLSAVALCAHLDTVPECQGAQPYVDAYGVVRNRLSRPLGADDKAGVAAILFGLRALIDGAMPHGDVVVVLTVAEELGLVGAGHLAAADLPAEMGLVLDGEGPIGTLFLEGPALARWCLELPADARSADEAAMRRCLMAVSARADARGQDGTAAVRIRSFTPAPAGGGMRVEGEVAAPDRRGAMRALVSAFAPLRRAANTLGFGWRARVRFVSHGYTVHPNDPVCRRVTSALRAAGIAPIPAAPGGASDADALCRLGIPAVNLGIGCEGAHAPGERIRLADVADAARVVAAFVAGT